jgi:hypothetical protein
MLENGFRVIRTQSLKKVLLPDDVADLGIDQVRRQK